MSYTELVGFKEGKPELSEEIRNAFRGAMAIWTILDETHLPPYYASWDPDKRISRASAMMDPNAIKEVWALANDEKVPIDERLVLGTTFDKVLVKRENLPRLIEAFKNFEKKYPDQSSISEQTVILETFFEDENVMAVGWNQTSVSDDAWSVYEEDEQIPYDINTMEGHWFLFENFKEEIK